MNAFNDSIRMDEHDDMQNVMVVDDCVTDRILIGKSFERDERHWSIAYAEGGRQALELMNEWTPDVVLSDMRMPDMDGLELLAELHTKHRGIPVVLVTGQGSEELAVQALRAGAANYVTKDALEQIPNVVAQVIKTGGPRPSYHKLIKNLDDVHHHLSLGSDPTFIPPLVDLLTRLTCSLGVCDKAECSHVSIALEEALINAMYHGNLELPMHDLSRCRKALDRGDKAPLIEARRVEAPFCSRRTIVDSNMSHDRAQFVITDEGQGFNPGLNSKLADSEQMRRQPGHGMLLMKTFMDDLKYNITGNQVIMEKRALAMDRS
jgi:CheY-like chemotaxis protein